MQKSKKRYSYIQVVCALSLFLLFSVCSLFLVTIGANNYKGVLGETDKSFNTNSSLHYVTNKLHSYDKIGGISLAEKDGVQVIVLNEDFSDGGYHTLIYCYDGYIFELLKQKNQSFKLGNGTKILPVKNFGVSIIDTKTLGLTAFNKPTQTLETQVSLKCVDVTEVTDSALS